MNISALLPTRGRPNGLRSSIASLLDLASSPDAIEILVRLDDDDPTLGECLEVLSHFPEVSVEVGPRYGYKRLYLYVNALASKAKGRLIFLWNDDTTMLTEGWDKKLLDMVTEIDMYSIKGLRFKGPVDWSLDAASLVQFMRRDICETPDRTFPVVGRNIYEAMGHISLNCHTDTWLWKVSEAAGVLAERPDIVFHHDRLEDLTSFERDRNYDMEGFDSEAMVQERAEDVGRIRERIFNNQEND